MKFQHCLAAAANRAMSPTQSAPTRRARAAKMRHYVYKVLPRSLEAILGRDGGDEGGPSPTDNDAAGDGGGGRAAAAAATCANMDDLVHLHEAAVLSNVGKRYARDLIYTRTGPILIAMNPFKWLDLYTPGHIQRYSGKLYGAEPPHCFQEAEDSYQLLMGGMNLGGNTHSRKSVESRGGTCDVMVSSCHTMSHPL